MPTVTKLEKPIVSQADASKAKTLLMEEENLAKARNSLYYWLTSKGLNEKFHALPCAERREYLEAWYAERMEVEKMVKKHVTTTTFVWTTKKGAHGHWKSKKGVD